LHFADALVAIVGDRRDRVETRLRKCLAFARLCRQARFEKIQGGRLAEFLALVRSTVDAEVPADPTALARPGWMGRVLFRQAAALYARQDHGLDRGSVGRSTPVLLRAANSFLRGRGPVPRVHARLPETTFERLEEPAGPLPEAAERALERYYTVKVASLQFCGRTNFGMGFWEGLEALSLTLPVILWLARAFSLMPRDAAILQAIGIVDNQFGFNPILGMLRQRLSLRLLAAGGELEKLIAWYSR
jgi:lysine-N-methylase